jgi:L-fuculose-phosphate aldolase
VDDVNDNERTLREEIVRVCLRMVELGINQGTAGNVSVRLGERFLITPSGIPYGELRPEQIASMDDGARYAGPCMPSTEWRLHREILRQRPEINVVIHTHSNYSTAVACLRRDLPAIHYYIVAGGGPTVRCADYATYGSPALAENAVVALHGRSACLLANHGMIVLGSTLPKTLKATFDLETVARQYIYASQIGEPVILPDDEIERVRLKMATYGDPSAHDAELVCVERRP